MRKRRTTEERYGRGYQDYKRIWQETQKSQMSKKDKSRRRKIDAMLTRREYENLSGKYEQLKHITNQERRDMGLKPLTKNINKQIIDKQRYELTEKQGKVIQKTMGKELAAERFVKELRRENPLITEEEIVRQLAGIELEPVYIPLSKIRAGEYSLDEEFREQVKGFWKDVEFERADLIKEYMSQGYSYSQASKMASLEIGRTFFDSE